MCLYIGTETGTENSMYQTFQDMVNKLIILKYGSSKNSVFRNGLCKVIFPPSILAIAFTNNSRSYMKREL